MPLSTELKWLSTFKIIFGQANHSFQNFIKSNTYHSNKTHWVKLLNSTSSDNWRSCWATYKVRERPWTAGMRWPILGDKDMAVRQWSSTTAVPRLISYSDKQPSAYPTKGSAWPQQEWKWGVHTANTNRKLVSTEQTLSPRVLSLNFCMH